MNNHYALEVQNIQKHYGGIHALKGIDLQVGEGEVCALVGENGAGKSTLIKILTGVEQLDEGTIRLFGQDIRLSNPIDARAKGITAIYQESSLIENLTVAQNIMLGHEPGTGFLGWNNNRELLRKTREYLTSFGIHIDPYKKVKDLGIGEKRIVEILKALSVDARILLLDEPTTGMSRVEIDSLFKIMQDLKQHSVTMIYISHHLEEVFQACDRIFVLRDGQNSGVFNTSEVDKPRLIKAMIGKELEEKAPEYTAVPRHEIIMEARDLLGEGMQAPVSFQLHAGEVLGITGIIGAGKSELGRVLFGSKKAVSGELFINGKAVKFDSPRAAGRNGVGYIPEDRKEQGLFLLHSIEDNITITALDSVSRWKTFLRGRKKFRFAEEIARKLRVVPVRVKMKVQNLSGGNQQKVVLGKWMVRNPQVLILDEPTRGVDVGAKAEIFSLVQNLAKSGSGVLLLSSEFDEVRQVCSRIIVLRNGNITGELTAAEATGDRLLSLSLGE